VDVVICIASKNLGQMGFRLSDGMVPLETLVVVYACRKEEEMNTRGRVDDALRKLGVIADLSSQPRALGMLKETVQTEKRVYAKPIFRYEWQIRVSSQVDDVLLQALRKELRDLEVNDIHIERV
jgi:hypothetical protein